MRTLARLGVVLLLVSPIALRGQSGSIPTPESVLGFQPGADFKLATYEQVVSYFQKVDAASDRMTMVQAGKTTQGRTFYFALISSKENLAKVDRYREIARRLAHPEGLTDAEAHALAREGKAFVHIDGGLHSTEIAGPQQTPQLLYDLLSRADQPETKPIFDNVILMLWPTINPDGQCDGGRLVTCSASTRRTRAVSSRRCRTSIRSTSATTTTATPTCSTWSSRA